MRTTMAIALLLPTLSWAAEPIIYPGEGQSAEQQQKDEGECFVWARSNSGFDPLAQSAAPAAPAAEQQRGGAVRGAAAGAAVGAIVGDSDDAKDGAAAGAVLGRMRQNRQNRQAEQAAQTQAQTQAAAAGEARSRFDRAYAACLKGRGYTVN